MVSVQLPQADECATAVLPVKVMGELEVPTAEREPLRMMLLPASALTVTPGSMVRVTPLSTVIWPVMMYGLLAAVHVVFSVIVPETEAAVTVVESVSRASGSITTSRFSKV